MYKKLLTLLFVFILIFTSCSDDGGKFPTKMFWAVNFTTNMFYQLEAELLFEGRLCTIWAEKGSGVSVKTARLIANEYDNNIYDKMIAAFGFTSAFDADGELFFPDGRELNTMEIADFYGDGDGKLCILLLDIRDNYQKEGDPSIAGYFYSRDFYDMPFSNKKDIIYMDTNPRVPGSRDSYGNSYP